MGGSDREGEFEGVWVSFGGGGVWGKVEFWGRGSLGEGKGPRGGV